MQAPPMCQMGTTRSMLNAKNILTTPRTRMRAIPWLPVVPLVPHHGV
eukprot:CAMPEP_0183341554 /NCGR_PEP_ID=MMETSP0164_2-20130417/7809_1 /TAXON_ID=221442 /ORGANISM="Coccolithus pelagicus ssp braarudi, Strain PLY182g" /LENGTH=46 /DNA_ID= /DNA_START= /DNA_END= /DNA_ORIENTATION=